MTLTEARRIYGSDRQIAAGELNDKGYLVELTEKIHGVNSRKAQQQRRQWTAMRLLYGAQMNARLAEHSGAAR